MELAKIVKVNLARARMRSSPRPKGISKLLLEGAGLYDNLGEVGVDDDEPLGEVPGAGLDLGGVSYSSSETWS